MKLVAIEIFDTDIERQYNGCEARLVVKGIEFMSLNELLGVAAKLEEIAKGFRENAEEKMKTLRAIQG